MQLRLRRMGLTEGKLSSSIVLVGRDGRARRGGSTEVEGMIKKTLDIESLNFPTDYYPDLSVGPSEPDSTVALIRRLVRELAAGAPFRPIPVLEVGQPMERAALQGDRYDQIWSAVAKSAARESGRRPFRWWRMRP